MSNAEMTGDAIVVSSWTMADRHKLREPGQPYQTRLDPPPSPPADSEGNFLPLPQWLPGQARAVGTPDSTRAVSRLITGERSGCGLWGTYRRDPNRIGPSKG